MLIYHIAPLHFNMKKQKIYKLECGFYSAFYYECDNKEGEDTGYFYKIIDLSLQLVVSIIFFLALCLVSKNSNNLLIVLLFH